MSRNNGASVGGFTVTETKILRVLADGEPHKKWELLEAMGDPRYTAFVTLRNHLKNIRKKLRPKGQDILNTRVNGLPCYRHIRVLVGPD